MAEAARIVVTGATGRLGRKLLRHLVTRPAQVQLLARTARGISAERRTNAVLNSLAPNADPQDRRVEVTAVDLAHDLPATTLPADDAGAVHIVHCAACTDPEAPPELAHRVNVEGTRRIVALAERLTDEGRLRRLDHVSCAHVAGTDPGIVTEADLDRGQRFASIHERTKYEAERIVRAAMDRIPATVHRPSLLTEGPLPVLQWPLPLLAANAPVRWRGSSPRCLDVVSVDGVADAMVALMADDATIGHTYHLTAGLGREVPMESLLNRALFFTQPYPDEVSAAASQRHLITLPRLPRGDVAKYAWFRRMRGTPFARWFPDRFWEASWRVVRWKPYLRGSTVRFDSRRTEDALHRLGVAPPSFPLDKES